ncbi:MAG: hypothetical protein KAW16_09325, partial [candidate division Zixibacteria bacterium]|nr:hypothetical protein [candidate division Zixibacteria bacterium]
MEKEKAFEILEKGLTYSEADQTELVFMGEDFSLTRFAENVICQNMSRADHTLMARVVLGKKVGVAVTNSMQDEDVKKVIKDAEEIAKYQQADPNLVSLPTSSPAPEVKGFFSKTSEYSPSQRAEGVGTAVRRCKSQNSSGTGAFQTETDVTCVVNSLGTRQYF